MPSRPRFDLRPGITEPVVLLISRQAIESGNVGVVAQRLRLLTASREDTWRYRSQVCLALLPALAYVTVTSGHANWNFLLL